MIRLLFLLICAACLGLVLAACGEVNITVDNTEEADPIEAMAGGDPAPEVDADIQFPWMGKQSVMCIGDAFERQVAFVDFTPDADAAPDSGMLGTASITADGTGEGTFSVPARTIRSGDSGRDEKLMGGAWLDADTHPEIVFNATNFERLAPTVWKLTGTWTMRGVTKEIGFFANIRYVAEMNNLGKDVIRLTGSFDINLKEFGMDNGSVGTPAVAEVWTVDVAILGLMVRK